MTSPSETSQLLLLLREQVEAQKEQTKFLNKWLDLWSAPQSTPVESRDYLMESIENEAAAGNVLAQDLLADEDLLKDYLRTLKTT